MSKFFYDGKASNNNESGTSSFGNKKSPKLGTAKAPAILSVQTEARKAELELILKENQWISEISVDPDKAEDIADLDVLQSTVTQAVSTKKANRNDPCPCGSEKKYKKCCGQ